MLESKSVIGDGLVHDSAAAHVSGSARYVDDLPQLENLLHIAIGASPVAHGRIRCIDLSEVSRSEGVVDIMLAEDIPGNADIGPVFAGDPLLAGDTVEFVGQPVFAVLATSLQKARQAVTKAQLDIEPLQAMLDLETAIEAKHFVRPPHRMSRGDAESAIADADLKIDNSFHVGGQEHFYLEGQVSLAIAEDDERIKVYASTQNPTETQVLVARVLDVPMHRIEVITRRMGGGFGGKETQSTAWSCLAALFAHKHHCAVSCRLSRADDMRMTGKRHAFFNRYCAGFSPQGQLQGIRYELAADCGYSADLSDAIVDRAMFHSDNAYFLPHVQIDGLRCKSNTVSHTAFRGFGGPQGMIAMETVMDEIAFHAAMDPLDVRKKNLYQPGRHDLTPYYQRVEHFPLADMIEQLEVQSDYRQRRQNIDRFNNQNPTIKKGIALTPVKFGISFTVSHLNQAGALVHLYSDGSIHLNHGGTEMGQGLMIKVAQIVASVFSVDLERIQISSTSTDKVPNTSPTAASSGTDLNGMAAFNAAVEIRSRLVAHLSETYSVSPDIITFANNRIKVDTESIAFDDAARSAWLARVPLSATGYYATPKIHYDRSRARGHPFLYYAYGCAVSEVAIDTLTGESRCLRVDILHDVGNSVNRAIDIGQIEGGFVQGMGWLTSEEVLWDASGRLITDGPATYKIPAIGDTPEIFNVSLLENVPNAEETIHRSKAVGEPPLMLAISVWCAIRDAIVSATGRAHFPQLNAPATPEEVLSCINRTRRSE